MAKERLTDEMKIMGMLPHLLGLFTSFIGPLIMFLVTKDRAKDRFAHENAKHALNFHISVIIYYIVAFILMIILIGFVLIVALEIFVLVVGILASVKSFRGEVYKYPLEIEFLK